MSRDYVFTAWTQPKPDEPECRYYCWGVERCPTTDKEHYQGFIVFKRQHRIPGAKRILRGGDSAHLEPRLGTREQARSYCGKDGELIEWGTCEFLGTKEILKKSIKYIKENEPLLYVRYHRGIDRLRTMRSPNWRDVLVTILWGPTGSGKTRTVMEKEDVYKIDPPYTWWDGYTDETIILLDDYRIGAMPRGMLLNVLDGYPLRLETKGGHVHAHWTSVFITTNFNPDIWEDAIQRRVSCIESMGNTMP